MDDMALNCMNGDDEFDERMEMMNYMNLNGLEENRTRFLDRGYIKIYYIYICIYNYIKPYVCLKIIMNIITSFF